MIKLLPLLLGFYVGKRYFDRQQTDEVVVVPVEADVPSVDPLPSAADVAQADAPAGTMGANRRVVLKRRRSGFRPATSPLSAIVRARPLPPVGHWRRVTYMNPMPVGERAVSGLVRVTITGESRRGFRSQPWIRSVDIPTQPWMVRTDNIRAAGVPTVYWQQIKRIIG